MSENEKKILEEAEQNEELTDAELGGVVGGIGGTISFRYGFECTKCPCSASGYTTKPENPICPSCGSPCKVTVIPWL